MKKILILSFIATGISCFIAYQLFYLNSPKTSRYQEPSIPLGYLNEEVTFKNTHAQVELAGTLTLPAKEGKFPAVILISGSGPQNRDGEYAGHKPFLVLADHLTRQGIAVLRYDDRDFGKSTGDFSSGTSLDFSFDVAAAVDYLKKRSEINAKKIGLIGHSDGAMIAPIVAADSEMISFIVLLAGPGIRCAELLLNRQELIERKLGLSEADIKKSRAHNEKVIQIISESKDSEMVKVRLTEFSRQNYDDIPKSTVPPGMTKEDFVSRQIEFFSSPWFKYLISYDPAETLRRVKCPVLALNGSKDVQVPSRENLNGILLALTSGGNSQVTIRELPGLNHMFQKCNTGMPDEYVKIDETFSPVALTEISEWIKSPYSD